LEHVVPADWLVTALDGDAATEVLIQTAGTLGSGDVDRLWEGLADRWKANANFLMSYGVGDQVAALSTLNAGSIAYASTDLAGVVTTVRTRPVGFSSYGFTSKLSGASHQNVAVCGDVYNGYLIAQHVGGMSVERVPQLFQQQTAGVGIGYPTAQRGWFAWARVGGTRSFTARLSCSTKRRGVGVGPLRDGAPFPPFGRRRQAASPAGLSDSSQLAGGRCPFDATLQVGGVQRRPAARPTFL